MNNEIKEEKSKAGVITAVVVAIAVIAGGIMLVKSNKTDTTVQKQETAAVVEAEPKEEQTTARIDISTKLVDAKKPQFEVYVDDAVAPVTQASWMHKYNIQGNVVQKEGNAVDVVIKAIKDADIDVVLKGPWEQDKDKKMVENWVKYTFLTVNGKKILSEPVSVWHNKTFRHTIKAKAGDEIKIHAEWTKADK